MVYKLSYVNDYLKQKEHKDYYVRHSDCPNDTSTFYVYELTHIEQDGLNVTDEIIRLNAKDGMFELMDKKSKKYKRLPIIKKPIDDELNNLHILSNDSFFV